MAKIYISLGSNIEPVFHLTAGLTALTNSLGQLQLSSVYESEAVGFDSNNFLNMVVAAETVLPVTQLIGLLKQIELDNGRTKASKKFTPRTLDLDLLLYGDIVSKQPIELPRAEIADNAFVLCPLAEIAPDLIHPVLQLSYAELWQQYSKPQKLWPIELSLI